MIFFIINALFTYNFCWTYNIKRSEPKKHLFQLLSISVPPCPDEPCGPSMSDTWDHYGPISSAAVNQFTPLVEYVNTSQLEKYRDEHLAPMNFKAGVLRFYDPKVSMTIMVNKK